MLDNIQNNAILGGIGCGNLVSQEAACHRQDGELLNNNFAVSLNIEPAGRYICTGVTWDTFSTPAGSFFVSGVETGEKSDTKNLIPRRCAHD